jgi:tartrate dehydrogenase/decarboxylase/D-malate dehydrogenase
MRQPRIHPTDGIGPEVIGAGLEVLDAVVARGGSLKLIVDHYDWLGVLPVLR